MGREASQQALEAIPRVRALSWDVVPWGLACFLLGLGSPGPRRHQAAHPTLGQVGRPCPDLLCCGWFRVRSREPEPRAPLCLCWAVGAGEPCIEPDRGPRLCVCSERGCPGSGSGGRPGPRKALGFSLAQPCSGSSGRQLLPVLQPQPLPGWGWGGVRAPRPP